MWCDLWKIAILDSNLDACKILFLICVFFTAIFTPALSFDGVQMAIRSDNASCVGLFTVNNSSIDSEDANI